MAWFNLQSKTGILTLGVLALSFSLIGGAILLGQNNSTVNPVEASAANAVPTSEDVASEYILCDATNVTSAQPIQLGASYLLAASSATGTVPFMKNTITGRVYMASSTLSVSTNHFVVPSTDTGLLRFSGDEGAYSLQLTNFSSTSNYFYGRNGSFYPYYKTAAEAPTFSLAFSGAQARLVASLSSSGYFVKYYASSSRFMTASSTSGYAFPSLYEKYGIPLSLSVSGNASPAVFGDFNYSPIAAGSTLSVKAYYRDGRYQDVTANCVYAQPSTNALGTQSCALTYTYGGVTASASYTCDVSNVNSSIQAKTTALISDASIYANCNSTLMTSAVTTGSDPAANIALYTCTNVALADVTHVNTWGPNWGIANPLHDVLLGTTDNPVGSITFKLARPLAIRSVTVRALRYGWDIGDYPATITISDGNLSATSPEILKGSLSEKDNNGGSHNWSSIDNELTGWANNVVLTDTITVTNNGNLVDFGGLFITYYDCNFTSAEQAAATKTYIEQFNTCPGSVSDAAVIRAAKEYNAMSTLAFSGKTSKSIFATLTLTADPNCTILNKLQTMVKWYNKNHDTKIYLYDATTYETTDNGGVGGYLPAFTDGAGHVVNPSSSASSLSLTLIIVAGSGVLTLLAVAGIYLVSKKKKRA